MRTGHTRGEARLPYAGLVRFQATSEAHLGSSSMWTARLAGHCTKIFRVALANCRSAQLRMPLKKVFVIFVLFVISVHTR